MLCITILIYPPYLNGKFIHPWINQCVIHVKSRYDHLKLSIQNLESPIRQILLLANRANNNSNQGTFDNIINSQVKNHLAEETTTEIYISNMDRSVTPASLQEYLMRNEINVINCKEALYRGWKNDYRVTIFKSDASKILNPNLWPKGIVCFICGEYYSTKTEGNRDPNQDANQDLGVDYNMKACVPPWMMS